LYNKVCDEYGSETFHEKLIILEVCGNESDNPTHLIFTLKAQQ